jgi:predicted DNA-binding WGR domain protein
MSRVYLVRHEPDKNLHRFYQMFVTPGLLDEWSLIREWGLFNQKTKKDHTKNFSSTFLYETS